MPELEQAGISPTAVRSRYYDAAMLVLNKADTLTPEAVARAIEAASLEVVRQLEQWRAEEAEHLVAEDQ